MLKVMLVDDDFVVLNGMANKVINWEALDCEIVGTASDGVEALRKIETLRPDVVFTDVVMPRMNGLELLEEIRKRWPDVHVVVISAYDESAYVRQSMHSDAVEYLLKPCREQEIAEAIAKIRGRMDGAAMRHQPENISDEDYNKIKALTGDVLEALKDVSLETVEMKTAKMFDQVETLKMSSMLYMTSVCVDLLTQSINVVKQALPDERSLEIGTALDMISRVRGMEELRSMMIRTMCGMALTLANGTAEMTRIVRQTYDIIEKRYMENLTAQQIANELHISVNTLQNHFKQEYGTTIRQYMTEVRIRQAKRQLRQTNDKIADICEQVGYHDTDYFTRVFREATGQTPHEYRKSGRK